MSQYTAPVPEAPGFVRRTEEFHTTTWRSILIGAASAIALQMLFTVLGLAIGVSVQDPDRAGTEGSASGLGTAAGIWWLVTGTIALAIGAMIMSCVSRPRRDNALLVRGFAMWSIVAIFGFIVIWSGLGMASMTAASPLATMAVSDRSSSIAGRMSGLTGTDRSRTTDSTTNSGDAGAGDRNGITSADRQQAASAARTASWWTVIGLMLGISASLLGAWYGAPRDDRSTRVRPISTPVAA